jgi:hypothetical protein
MIYPYPQSAIKESVYNEEISDADQARYLFDLGNSKSKPTVSVEIKMKLATYLTV